MPRFLTPKIHSLLTCRRQNYVKAAQVNAALRILSLYGLQRAENFLRRENIPKEVIIRVLQSHALIRQRV